MRTELIKVYDGYTVKVNNLYINGSYGDKYFFTTDYTYAKHYSLKTATKHLNRIKRRWQE